MSEHTADTLTQFLQADWALHVFQLRYGGEFCAFVMYKPEDAVTVIDAAGGGDWEGVAMTCVLRSEAVMAGIGKTAQAALQALYDKAGEHMALDAKLQHEWHNLHLEWLKEAKTIAERKNRDLSKWLQGKINAWKKKLTQVRITACGKSDCPLNGCACACHDPGVSMMHMFACCETQKCPKCGETKHGIAADGGVYYKEKQ